MNSNVKIEKIVIDMLLFAEPITAPAKFVLEVRSNSKANVIENKPKILLFFINNVRERGFYCFTLYYGVSSINNFPLVF